MYIAQQQGERTQSRRYRRGSSQSRKNLGQEKVTRGSEKYLSIQEGRYQCAAALVFILSVVNF